MGIYARRWQNQQGRSGYSVTCYNEWVQGLCNKPRIEIDFVKFYYPVEIAKPCK